MKKIQLAFGIHLFTSATGIFMDRAFGFFGGSSMLGWENNPWWLNEIGLVIALVVLAWSFWFLEDK